MLSPGRTLAGTCQFEAEQERRRIFFHNGVVTILLWFVLVPKKECEVALTRRLQSRHFQVANINGNVCSNDSIKPSTG